MRTLSGTFAVLVAVIALQGCAILIDGSVTGLSLVPSHTFGPSLQAMDLDYDGNDEVIFFASAHGTHEAWLLARADGSVIDQVNIPGRVVGDISVGEFDQDSASLEILIPVSRSDSLFLYPVGLDGRLAGDPVFIASGNRRYEPGGLVFPWEAEAAFRLIDIDGDGSRELLSMVNATYAHDGRGVYLHTMEGKLLDKYLVGAPIGAPALLGDIDSDGVLEVLVETATPNHGADVNGFSDDIAHVISIELSTPLRIDFRLSSPVPFTGFEIHSGAFGADGPNIVIVETEPRANTRPESRVWIYNYGEPMRDQPPRGHVIPHVATTASADLDGNGILELYGVTRDGLVLELGLDSGAVVGQTRVAEELSQVASCPDIDGDGLEELCVGGGNYEASYILGAGLQLKHISPLALDGSNIVAGGIPYMTSLAGQRLRVVTLGTAAFVVGRYGALLLFMAMSSLLLILAWIAFRSRTEIARKSLLEDSLSFVTSRPSFLIKKTVSGPQSPIGVYELRVALDCGFRRHDFNVQAMAEALHRSERQLLRDSKRLTGMSSKDLLRNRRVHEAVRLLLARPELSVHDIAREAGWQKTAALEVAFFRSLGMKPDHFRTLYSGRGYLLASPTDHDLGARGPS